MQGAAKQPVARTVRAIRGKVLLHFEMARHQNTRRRGGSFFRHSKIVHVFDWQVYSFSRGLRLLLNISQA